MRVHSGGRTMTVRQAIVDEREGGDFLTSMTDSEFRMFQKKLSIYVIRKRRKAESA